MARSSLLDQQITLGDIIDADALERVCVTFARLFSTGVSVLDHEGKAVVNAKNVVRLGNECAGSESTCPLSGRPEAVEELSAMEQSVRDCVCGLQTASAKLSYQGHTLGFVVLGPFRNIEDVESGVFRRGPDRLEASKAVRPTAPAGLSAVLTRTGDEVFRALDAVREVLSVIVQTGYARHLTSQIHIAAIQDAYNELIEKNRRLADSVEKLKELDRLKSTFLATVSHELRTPLTSIIGYTEMLQEEVSGPVNEQQRGYLDTVMRKGDQLLQLINEILDFASNQSGKVQLSYADFDLQEVLCDVRDTMIPQTRRKRLALLYDPESQALTMRGDRAKIRQILINLLSNAIKFTDAAGEVRLTARLLRQNSTEARGDIIEVRILDTGIGIAPDERDRIFDAFYQIDNTATRQHGGTGLGLSVVKHFVKAHGGQIWIEDPPRGSCGSVFVVQLPRDAADAAPAAENASAPSRIARG